MLGRIKCQNPCFPGESLAFLIRRNEYFKISRQVTPRLRVNAVQVSKRQDTIPYAHHTASRDIITSISLLSDLLITLNSLFSILLISPSLQQHITSMYTFAFAARSQTTTTQKYKQPDSFASQPQSHQTTHPAQHRNSMQAGSASAL